MMCQSIAEHVWNGCRPVRQSIGRCGVAVLPRVGGFCPGWAFPIGLWPVFEFFSEIDFVR